MHFADSLLEDWLCSAGVLEMCALGKSACEMSTRASLDVRRGKNKLAIITNNKAGLARVCLLVTKSIDLAVNKLEL